MNSIDKPGEPAQVPGREHESVPSRAGAGTRRSYLGWLIGLCTAGVSAALSVPLIRFALYPLTTRTTEVKWSDVGPVAELQASTAPLTRTVKVEQVDGWRKEVSDKVVYVATGKDGQLRVLSAVCPHLGCSIQWVDSSNQFVCPCHSASFSQDGVRIGGPAPRAMDVLQTTMRDGRLLVRYEYFRQSVSTQEVIG